VSRTEPLERQKTSLRGILSFCRDVQVVAPFPVDAIEHSTHKTYLDSTGRPRVTVSKKFAAESHEQDIYVSRLVHCSIGPNILFDVSPRN
jgi:hypothetical protein